MVRPLKFFPLEHPRLPALSGINLCLFLSYLYITRFRRIPREISPLVFWTACLMFAFSTVHVSLGFARLIWGFIDYRDESGGPAAFFSDVSQPPNVAKVIIHTINSILGDSIVVRSPSITCLSVASSALTDGPRSAL